MTPACVVPAVPEAYSARLLGRLADDKVEPVGGPSAQLGSTLTLGLQPSAMASRRGMKPAGPTCGAYRSRTAEFLQRRPKKNPAWDAGESVGVPPSIIPDLPPTSCPPIRSRHTSLPSWTYQQLQQLVGCQGGHGLVGVRRNQPWGCCSARQEGSGCGAKTCF